MQRPTKTARNPFQAELQRLKNTLAEQKRTINSLKREINFLTYKHEGRVRFPASIVPGKGKTKKTWMEMMMEER